MAPNPHPDLQKLEAAITAQENLRGILPDEQIEAAIAALREKQVHLARADQGSAIAQGEGATAIARQGVGVTGDVTSSTINTGLVYNIYQSPPGKGRLSERDFEHILRGYLEWVYKAYGKARLYGLESVRTTRERPRRQLADVFVPLSLRRFSPPARDEIERLAAEQRSDPLAQHKAYLHLVDEKRAAGREIPLAEILTLQSQLAIIGGAGSGKSTLAAFLAVSLAGVDQSPFELPKGREQLIPLLVPLRYYQEYLHLCHSSPREMLVDPRKGTLAGFIPWYLKRRSPVLELSEDFFDRLLLGGGCLLVLDGLDEVVSRDGRGQVREQVERLANDIYPGNLLIVTAREAGYRENAVFGDDFLRLDVQPLGDEQIETLVRNWCQQLYPEGIEAQTQAITAAIQDINQRYRAQKLPPLVSTPLMTTMVVSVKWGETELPRERAKLYEAAVKVILQAQYTPEEGRQEVINWGGHWEDQREWLSHLALAMHHGGRASAAISEEQMRTILQDQLSPEALEAFIQAVRMRGGLFEERGELFQFIHLTFQEFLAARLLAKQRRDGLANLAEHVSAPWWREVLLLLFGFAKTDYTPFAGEYLDWLSQLQGEACLAGLELAAAAVLEIELPDKDLRRQQAGRLASGLEDRDIAAPAALRAAAGNTLAALGDPRPEVTTLEGMAFCLIPPGPFVMGGDKYSDEKPVHTNDCLDYPYWLGRYPVTVAQWWAYVELSGTSFDRWQYNTHPNHPVVDVTWYEAQKFCAWLNQKYTNALPDGYHFGLPSEAEWEKAARGGKQVVKKALIASLRDGLVLTDKMTLIDNPSPGREYPWQGDFEPDRANISETGIGMTSTVGCFLAGASPYGVLDLSGNVWEWTRSIWDNEKHPYPYDPTDGRENLNSSSRRVLRGGAFYVDQDLARCACRGRVSPGYRFDYVGFRVVVRE